MTRQQHWDAAYQADGPAGVSWYQARPALSLALIAATGAPRDAGVIDVGGGASTLIDCLLDAGYSSLAVLDLSSVALGHARTRLGERATAVHWFAADVTSFELPHRFGIWHDRAVFHFLTDPADRRGYVSTLLRTLQPGGHVVIATFAPDGPPKCSGLEIVRYDEASLVAELGPSFALRESHRETHTTPWQTEQRFIYFRFQHLPE
ncbi:MAG: SAM-dependent methyltransferase [Verrucomicrobia bacterium]|nr:MAG: SAM-dependent methyltransferase [Verrucomicrobiota bacterium]